MPVSYTHLAAFEEDLGIILFIRNGKKISLTEEGILLKRRALEILNLEEDVYKRQQLMVIH